MKNCTPSYIISLSFKIFVMVILIMAVAQTCFKLESQSWNYLFYLKLESLKNVLFDMNNFDFIALLGI